MEGADVLSVAPATPKRKCTSEQQKKKNRENCVGCWHMTGCGRTGVALIVAGGRLVAFTRARLSRGRSYHKRTDAVFGTHPSESAEEASPSPSDSFVPL